MIHRPVKTGADNSRTNRLKCPVHCVPPLTFIYLDCDWFVVVSPTESSSPLIAIVIAAVVILALVIGAVGFFVYRKKNGEKIKLMYNNVNKKQKYPCISLSVAVFTCNN